MKSIFKFGKVLFGTSVVMLTACLSTVFAGPRILVPVGVDTNGKPIFSVTYKGDVAKDETRAMSMAMQAYFSLRPRLKFDPNPNSPWLDSCKTKGILEKAIKGKMKSGGQIQGNGALIANCLQIILDENHIENYLLHINELNSSGHTAVMYKKNNQWFVADPSADVQMRSLDPETIPKNFPSNLMFIKLEKYPEIIKSIFGFGNGMRLGIEVSAEESNPRDITVIPLEIFQVNYPRVAK